MVLVSLSAVRSAGTVYAGRDRSARQRADRGRKFQKIGVQHDGKNLFCALFLIFSKKLFRAQNPCFRLFSPVLRTPTRACVFIIFEKNGSKIFSKNLLTVVCTTAIIGTVNRTGAQPPDR